MKINKQKIYSITIKTMWIGFLSGAIILALYIFSVSNNWFGLYGEMPSAKSLENPENDLSAEIYSSDGVLLGKYFKENRTLVEFDDLSPNLINALVATEDYRFYEHSGVDLRGLMRVAIKTVILGRRSGGGSTISQQLAKNLLNTRSKKYEGALSKIPILKTIIVKTKEWILAVKLERSYTKQEILAMYLNTVDFGSNAFGVKVAAKTFFNTTPDSLTTDQAAVLVGLLKAPTTFSPILNPENSKKRRNVVMNQMLKYEFIDQTMYDSLKTKDIDLSNYNVENHNKGLAPYLRAVSKDFLLKWADENGYDLYEDGLKIYTTIDSRMQEHAERAIEEEMQKIQKKFIKHLGKRTPWTDKNYIEKEARRSDRYRTLVRKYGRGHDSIDIVMNTPVKMRVFSWNAPNNELDTIMTPIDSIKHYQSHLHAGFMAMDPYTGQIKAWVGGINFKHFKYDHVKQGKRQPGSTFKPMVYATAIDQGYPPCYEVTDIERTYRTPGSPPYTPKNSTAKFTNKKMTIRYAMANSVNSVTIYMMDKVKPENVVKMAQDLGVNSPLEAVYSLALGTSDVSIFELVGAYATFVNEGVWTEPFFITRIEDKNENVLEEFVPKRKEAISKKTAFLMLHMLQGTVDFGTAAGLSWKLRKADNNGKLEIGAKTGTTQENSDGWFMGITKDLAAGAWVGGDTRKIRFRSTALGQGAKTAMPIWENFMLRVYNDPKIGFEKGLFKRPKDLDIELDCKKYKEVEIEDERSIDGESPI